MICPGPNHLCPAQNDQKGVRATTGELGIFLIWVFCRRPQFSCLIIGEVALRVTFPCEIDTNTNALLLKNTRPAGRPVRNADLDMKQSRPRGRCCCWCEKTRVAFRVLFKQRKQRDRRATRRGHSSTKTQPARETGVRVTWPAAGRDGGGTMTTARPARAFATSPRLASAIFAPPRPPARTGRVARAVVRPTRARKYNKRTKWSRVAPRSGRSTSHGGQNQPRKPIRPYPARPRSRSLRNHTGFCARAVGCWCPWGALARYPSVPAPCSCPLPFSARRMPAPFCGRYSFATRSLCVLLLVQLLVPRRAPPTRRLPLPALCSYPFAARARPMPVPAHCPCPLRARAPTPPFAQSRSCACATTRARARAMAPRT